MGNLKIALAGNPNCGKTTLFNDLTGSNQYVGNWPGVTVEKKEGRLRTDREVTIQDLPGIYSLSPYTLEEVVTRTYLVEEKPDAILNIIDGTNIERNLYLTTQLVELGIPMVIGVNMMDLVKKNGDVVDMVKLGKALGCEVLPMSALKNDQTLEVASAAVEAGKSKKHGEMPHVFAGSVEHAIAHIEESIESYVDKQNLRWFAVKVFERDEKVLEKLNLPKDVYDHIEEHIRDCEAEMDDDAESIITNQRYEYIQSLVAKAVVKHEKKDNLTISDKIDRIVTNRILALPIFALMMCLVYYIAITKIGGPATDWANDTLFGGIIQPGVSSWLESIHASASVQSLIVDGIIGGVGTVLGFTPQMAVVFLLLGFLEDVGYMARVAFIMDRAFRKFGLSGKSFIPFLISSGCGVPGILATRTIESEKDRRMTMIVTTNIPCGAKLPVIALIGSFIAGEWWIAPAMYFTGIAIVVIACIILKKTKEFSGDPVPFVMELPAYHLPTIKSLLMHMWERVWAFVKKAGTILFVCAVVMWFLATYGIQGGSFGEVDVENSFLAVIGKAISILFAPLGFTWQAVASTISGFVAKENLVSTMGVLAGLQEADEYSKAQIASFFPTVAASMSFLIFNLFDSPCLAAISTVAKEIGSRKHFWKALLFQNVLAYCVALIVYQIGGVFVTGEIAFNAATVVAFILIAGLLYLLFRPDPNKVSANGLKKAA
ncbi:MAG: ferrous iron transport protein B [Lachnospiraceae bacterium]|nr:ferrous iron transport protein B [Lachnospiraceae bacterium]